MKSQLFKMATKLLLRDKEYEVRPGITLLQALKELNIPAQSVIAARGEELILEDEILKDEEIITLIPVISGG
jgi:sulfur carrier protein ThiS